MASDPQATPQPKEAVQDAVEMPRPTVAPLVLALGLALLAAGVALGAGFLVVGAVIAVAGLTLWIVQLLPGRGHAHEPLLEPARRSPPVTGSPGSVEKLRPGMPGFRFRLPEDVYPISAGLKGGIAGGVAMAIPALLWGLLSSHHSLWYPINLLAGMVLPGVGQMSVAELEQFQPLAAAGGGGHSRCHVGGFRPHFRSTAADTAVGPPGDGLGRAAGAACVDGVSYILMGMVNPGLQAGVSWPWFILSQFVYGVAMALVVTQATDLSPRRAARQEVGDPDAQTRHDDRGADDEKGQAEGHPGGQDGQAKGQH